SPSPNRTPRHGEPAADGAVAGPGFARVQRYERRIVLTHVDAMQGWGRRRPLRGNERWRSSDSVRPRERGPRVSSTADGITAYAGMSGESGGPTSAAEPLIHAATSAATGSTTKRYLRPRASVAHQQSRSSSQP